MNDSGKLIRRFLEQVALERLERGLDAALSVRVTAVKHLQHLRFQQTYADLLADPRYSKAARFFLEDLYGPGDFTARDEQFGRIVPALVRLFPAELVETVCALAELHALSEQMDSAMGSALRGAEMNGENYGVAWRAVGRPEIRTRQIELMLVVGAALDRYTRSPILRHSLRLMRSPAKAAGLGALQAFLESGFDTFREMRGADAFLNTIYAREHDLADRLFAGDGIALTAPSG